MSEELAIKHSDKNGLQSIWALEHCACSVTEIKNQSKRCRSIFVASGPVQTTPINLPFFQE